jgi:hypothetical protein
VSPVSIEETAASGRAEEPPELMPTRAWPCGLTAIEGIQNDLPPESKIVPERESVGVELRFESSYQRVASRSGDDVALPLESTPIAWLV